ncbi:MAG: hypothetical protein IJX86_07210 [Lachnospiraceae bacterium]|nr:hypothetical protein [Lachnospiraceae bacterium]
MKRYLQAIGVWVCIIPIAILNGGLRENVLVKLGQIAQPLSGIILSICIFAVALCLIPKIQNCKTRDYWFFGIIWFVLTNLFDLTMILKSGGSFSDLLKAYNFLSGNTWILVVLTALIAPGIVAKIRNE